MSLPVIDQPTFNLNIPSTGKRIKYRAFTVKEEKILLLALESEDQEAMVDAIGQIINNCTFGKIDEIEDLPYFDIEYIFIQLRKKSVSDVIHAKRKCEECDFELEIDVDLNKVKIDQLDKKSNIIEVTDKIGMELTYPTISKMNNLIESSSDFEKMFELIASLIVTIYEGETIYKADDYSIEDKMEFLEGLGENAFTKIQGFMTKMPTVYTEVKIECPQCNHENNIRLEGLYNFFV